MNEHDRTNVSNAPAAAPAGSAPVAESPDRADPRLLTTHGEPLDAEVSVRESRRDLRRLEAEIVRTTALDTEGLTRDATTVPKPETHTGTPAPEQMQQFRRIDEFDREARQPRPWDGAEHVGTVVAVERQGAVVHVGRHQYVHVPAPPHAPYDPQLVGRRVSVDKTGAVRETPEPSRDVPTLGRADVERGNR